MVVRDLSGFGRSARDLLNDIQTLKDCSVIFIGIKEGIDGPGGCGRFMLTIFAAIAELEREMTASRMKENRLEIVPDQGEVYSRIVKGYLDPCRSFNDV